MNQLNEWLKTHVFRRKNRWERWDEKHPLNCTIPLFLEKAIPKLRRPQIKDNEIHIIEESELIRYPLRKGFLYENEFRSNIGCAMESLKNANIKKDEAKEKVEILNNYWLDTIAGAIFEKSGQSITNPFKIDP